MTNTNTRWLAISTAATLLLAAVLVLAASAAWAQPRGPHGRFGNPGDTPGFGGPGMLRGLMAERLELTDEQRETIQGIIETQRETMRPWHEDMARLGDELEDAIHAEPFDEEAVRALAQQVADVRVEVAVARARVAQEVRSVLTPDQRETLGELKAQRQSFRRQAGPGRGRGWRSPSPDG